MTYDEALRIFRQCCGSLSIEPQLILILMNKKLLHKTARGLARDIVGEEKADAILFQALSIIVKASLV